MSSHSVISAIPKTVLSTLKWSDTERADICKMTVEEFLTIRRFDANRDETIRTNKAHLSDLGVPHYFVHIAVYKDGDVAIIDGNTRKLKWEKKTLERPQYLCACVHYVSDSKEAEKSYDALDSSSSSKNGNDAIQSGLFKHGVNLKTDWLRSGKISSALTAACRYTNRDLVDKREMVNAFKKELALFDQIKPKAAVWRAPATAAALLGLRKYGNALLPWLRIVNDGGGIADGRKKDSARWFHDYAIEAKGTNYEAMKTHLSVMLPNISRFSEPKKLFLQRADVIADIAGWVKSRSAI